LLLGPQLRAFRDAGYEVHAASAPGPYVAALEADGIVHHPLHHSTRTMSLRDDVKAMRELYALMRAIRPDIVHTHNPKPGVYGRPLARLARVPLVINTQHGLYAQRTDPLRRRALVYGLERTAAAFSHVELVQSTEDVDTLARLRVRRRKLRLLGNGVDLERFRPPSPDERARARRELGWDDGQVVVGAVGRLVWEKGYAELFAAARQLLRDRADLRIIVVGPFEPEKGDPLTERDVADAEQAGVEFLGLRADVERIYAALDVYVLASHREGFPRSAMEAAACGVPVIATDIRGCRQVVDHERTGLLVPVRDAGALADAIGQLADRPDDRERMGAAGAAKALVDFDQQRVIDITLSAYDQLALRAQAR
jgi:glycosyltransferase involved in cell wall biosynthesis